MMQLANDQPTEALTALRMAVALGDDSPTTLLNLALAQEKTGDTERALTTDGGVGTALAGLGRAAVAAG